MAPFDARSLHEASACCICRIHLCFDPKNFQSAAVCRVQPCSFSSRFCTSLSSVLCCSTALQEYHCCQTWQSWSQAETRQLMRRQRLVGLPHSCFSFKLACIPATRTRTAAGDILDCWLDVLPPSCVSTGSQRLPAHFITRCQPCLGTSIKNA